MSRPAGVRGTAAGGRNLAAAFGLPSFLVAATLLSLAYATLAYFSSWPRLWDIAVWDETNILGSSIYGWYGEVTSYELQPAHMLVYRLLHLAIGDPIHLYYAAGLATVVLAILGMLAGAWSLSGNLLFACLCAVLLIGSGALMYESRAMYTAIGVLGCGAAIALRHRSFVARAAALTVIALVLALTRPEFVLSFYLLLGMTACALAVFAWHLARGRIQDFSPRLAVWLVALYALIGTAICVAYEFPVLSGSDRDFLAFGQHYASWWAASHHAGFEGGLSWQTVMDAEFPGAHTEMQALRMYPEKVLRFFVENITDIPRLYRTRTPTVWAGSPALAVAIVAAWLLLAGSVVQRWRRQPSGRPAAWRSAADLVLLLPFLLPQVAAVVLVYPHPRYLTLLGAVLLLCLARLVRGANRAELAAAAGLSLLFAVSVTPRPAVAQPHLTTIQALRDQRPIREMLEIGMGWCAYLEQPCNRIGVMPLPPEERILPLVDGQRADAVLVSPELVEFARVRKDQAFLDWLAETPAGWSRVDLPAGQYVLLRDAP